MSHGPGCHRTGWLGQAHFTTPTVFAAHAAFMCSRGATVFPVRPAGSGPRVVALR